jgi:hypothetical protein
MGGPRTGKADRRLAPAYIDKASDFYNGMVDAAARGNWTVAASSAVHCAINSCDAVAVNYHGLKPVASFQSGRYGSLQGRSSTG